MSRENQGFLFSTARHPLNAYFNFIENSCMELSLVGGSITVLPVDHAV